MDPLKDIIPPESYSKFYSFKRHLLRRDVYCKLTSTLSFPFQYKISVIIIVLPGWCFYNQHQ